MNDRYRLGGLENDQLLASLSALVKRENDSLSDLLAHLAELDQRELCVAMGYSSLFAYCTEALGFCKSSAGRRIAAARVCRAFPEAFPLVASCELQLSVLCALRPYVNAENANELFTECSRKSYEQVELLLAARFPKPDVRDLVRRLPASALPPFTPHIGSDTLESPPNETKPDTSLANATKASVPAQLPPMQREPRTAARGGVVKPLSADRFSVNFTADSEFRELLDEVRALLSHSEPEGGLLVVMKRGLGALRSQLLKRRFGVGRKPRRVRSKIRGPRAAASTTSEGAETKHNRHVPAAVAREVYVRDEGRCTFCADDGRRCAERRFFAARPRGPVCNGRRRDGREFAATVQGAQSARRAGSLWGGARACRHGARARTEDVRESCRALASARSSSF